jgi:hypothetical protein
VLVRYTDSNNFLMLRVNASTSTVDLYKKVGGVLSQVASQPYSVAQGEFLALRADVRGSSIDGWVDGAKLISWTNPVTQLTSGKVGVRSAASAVAVDEVVVRG